MTLATFLKAEAARPFAWGRDDCVHMAARWLRQAFVWPLPPFPRPRCAADYARLSSASPLSVMVRRWAWQAGVQIVHEAPLPGDVGVVLHGGRELLAIRGHGAWAARDASGVVLFDDADCLLLLRP